MKEHECMITKSQLMAFETLLGVPVGFSTACELGRGGTAGCIYDMESRLRPSSSQYPNPLFWNIQSLIPRFQD